MTYHSSRARRAFEDQLDQELHEITSLYRAIRKNGADDGARLLAAYYVLAFAQLEVYIKNFVEDTLNAVSLSGPSLDKWPDLMVAYLLHKGENLGSEYRKFGHSEDEGPVLERVAQTARKVAAWGRGGAMPGTLDAGAFLDKKKYPSPKNLPQLFRRLGVNQVWAVVDSTGRMNSKLTLTSLNDLRTNIAHEGKVPTGFGLVEFRDMVAKMRHLVAAIDRGVSKQFCSGMIPRVTWNGTMT